MHPGLHRGATQFSPGRKAWVKERRAAIPLAPPHPRKHFLRCSLLLRPSALSRGPSSRPQRRDLSSILKFSLRRFSHSATNSNPSHPSRRRRNEERTACKSKAQLRSELLERDQLSIVGAKQRRVGHQPEACGVEHCSDFIKQWIYSVASTRSEPISTNAHPACRFFLLLFPSLPLAVLPLRGQ